MSDRRVSKEELEAFWRGDKDTYQKMYSQRMQQRVKEAEAQGKKVTYVPNDGSQTLPEVTITAPRETEEQKQARLKQDYENFTDNAITVAGFVPGLGTATDIVDVGNSLRKGDTQAALWGLVGVGLPGSGKMWRTIYNKAKTPFKTFYHDVYPKLILALKKYNKFEKDFMAFFRTDITENPIKAVRRNRLYRNRWNHPKIDVEDVTLDPSIITNSQEDAMELTKKRWFNGGRRQIDHNNGYFSLKSDQELWDVVSDKDYASFKDIWKEAKGLDWFTRITKVPKLHLEINSAPGVLFHGRRPTVYINENALKQYYPKVSINVVKAHEYEHGLNNGFLSYPRKIFDYKHLPKKHRDYLERRTELSARGNQLKNYFGFTNVDQVITGDMLKYAAKHYVPDTNMDNNMLQFFSGIKDWDAAADWLSKYSLKKGGKLCQ